MDAPWFVSGASGASDLICDRRPVLHNEEFDDGQTSKEMRDADERLWVGESSILPPSVAAAKVSFDSGRPQLESHIAAMRERGRAYNESLKERYEVTRESFQREQAALIERQGCLSTFEMSLREKARDHGQVPEVREEKKEDTGIKSFAAGFMRVNRQTTNERVSVKPGAQATPSSKARNTAKLNLLNELKGA